MKFSSVQKKKILYIVFAAVFLLVCILCTVQIVRTNRKNSELEKRRERLEQLIAEEEQRRTDLEDEEVYVRTRKYIEEKAKSIGYVYPDEIIFREDD